MSVPTPTAAGRKAGSANRPIAVDLFAGAGGLSLGLEQAGFDVAAAVEYDPVHAATHEYNFPCSEVLCADIAEPLEPSTLRAAISRGLIRHGRDVNLWDGEIDLIAGGPPCQGFSLIGKRLVDDSRNQLVFHFFRLVKELQPRYFVMENVPGMTRGGHAGILDALISEFESAGYRFPEEAKYKVLNAADYGVPQDRKRLFLIGTRSDQEVTATPPPPTVTPVPKRHAAAKHVSVPCSSLPSGPSVIDAIGDLPNPTRFRSLIEVDELHLTEIASERIVASASEYARYLRGEDASPLDLSYPRDWDRSVISGCIRTTHADESIRRFKATKPGTTEPISRFYRLDPLGLCNTLRAGSGSERGAFTSPRPLHPIYPRVLTNREAARLHSFPDWFRPHSTKWHGFRQIGNAVAPLVGRAVGRQIVEALSASIAKPTSIIELGHPDLLGLTMSTAAERFGASPANIPAGRTRGADPKTPSGEAPLASNARPQKLAA